MRLGKRSQAGQHTIDEATNVAVGQSASVGIGTILTAAVSLLALLMSGVSLYQTVLKQANLHLFVPDTISYTRDPNGSFEVLAVPVTIANSGARDGVISSIELKVTNKEDQRERTLHATFVADQGYFSTKEDFREGVSRPKTAFAPLTIAGRSSYSGTLLFYPRTYSEKRVVSGAGTFEFVVSAKVQAVEKLDLFDQLAKASIEPITFEAKLPTVSRFFDGQMLSGKTARLYVASPR